MSYSSVNGWQFTVPPEGVAAIRRFTDQVRSAMAELESVVEADGYRIKTDDDVARAAREFVITRRSGQKRRITGDFLRQVAEVYRTNIGHAPTEAVARTFGVKHRQATDYVRQARDRGFLPPTKQGRAKA
jgi:hypothetical protein